MSRLVLLKSQAEFEAFRASKSFASPLLKIRVRPANQNAPRFGFIVPKKVLPKAADRNKLKRRMKSILFSIQAKLRPMDVLLFPSAMLLKKKFSALETAMLEIFSKARLWKS